MKGREAESIDGQSNFLFFFEDHQLFVLDVVVGRLQDGLQGNKTDNLRTGDGHVQLLGVLACLFVGRVDGRHIVIRQVERDLSDLSLVQPPADSLDGLESARLIRTSSLLAKIQRDPMRLLFGSEHVDVKGYEKFPDACRRGAPPRHELGRAEIRFPFFLGYLSIQVFF